MMNITAGMVADLREVTGLGMMECKKALVEANGDIKKAEEILRIKSGIKASKVANRIATEGIIEIFISENNKSGVILEINCETDFVAKDTNFTQFATNVARAIVNDEVTDIALLSNIKLPSNKTIEEERKDLIAKIGENISIRRIHFFKSDGIIASYLHGKKIGVIADMESGDIQIGKDIAMHVVANKPLCVSKDEVPLAKIEEERHIFMEQAKNSGKSTEIITKMVDGRINKFLSEVTLLGQNFVKNPEITVEKYLKDNNAKVKNFALFIVGEGLEKKTIDFVKEVQEASNIKH